MAELMTWLFAIVTPKDVLAVARAISSGPGGWMFACFGMLFYLAVKWRLARGSKPRIRKRDADDVLDQKLREILTLERPTRVLYFARHNGDKKNLSLVGRDHEEWFSCEWSDGLQSEFLPYSEWLPIAAALAGAEVAGAHENWPFRVVQLLAQECGPQWKRRFETLGCNCVWVCEVLLPDVAHHGFLVLGFLDIPGQLAPTPQVRDGVFLGNPQTIELAQIVGYRAQYVLDRALASGWRGLVKRGAAKL